MSIMRSRREIMAAGFVAALLLPFALSCKSPRRTEPIVGNLAYAEASRLAQGRQAFDRHCHYCHPDGDGGLGPNLNDKPLPGTLIQFQVRHGLGVMPSFASHHLSNADLESIVAYLKDLRKRRPPSQ